jgi:hypothetical protein
MTHARRSILLMLVPLIAACAPLGQRAEREEAWARFLATEVPTGTTREDARQMLESRGLVVQYRPYANLGERPDECPAARLYAFDRGRVQGLASRFDVRLILCLDNEDRVSRRYVDRFNSII